MTSVPASSVQCGGYIVRRVQPSDIEAVMRLADTVPTAARWPRAAFDAYCIAERPESDVQAKALFVSCVQDSHFPSGKVIGFAAFSAVAHRGTGESELENMAVAEEWRRRGIGRRLLAAGLLWCRTQSGPSLWLEVRASNHGAIAFYEHVGFMVAGRRPSYYAQPTEDAILMRKE